MNFTELLNLFEAHLLTLRLEGKISRAMFLAIILFRGNVCSSI